MRNNAEPIPVSRRATALLAVLVIAGSVATLLGWIVESATLKSLLPGRVAMTEGSFDAFMWQALETKARFIAQVMTGQAAVRRSDDVGSHELSYAEVKAIASGNPAVLTLAEADAELQRLAILKKNHTDEQYVASRKLRDLPGNIAQLQERLTGLEADGATIIANADTSMVIGGHSVPADAVLAALGRTLESLPLRVGERRPIPLGQYQGLAFGIILYPHFPPEVFLEGKTMRTDPLSRDHHGPRAVLNALQRLAGSYEPEAARVRQNLAIAEPSREKVDRGPEACCRCDWARKP